MIYSGTTRRYEVNMVKDSLKSQFADQLDAWQSSDALSHPLNGDLSMRVVSLADEAKWQPSPIENTEVRLLEYRDGSNPRFTALLRLSPGASESDLGYWRMLEALILNGSLTLTDIMADCGNYLRLPRLKHSLFLKGGNPCWPLEGQLYVAYAGGHYSKEDKEPRLIDTQREDAWLPGPTDAVEVLPLHVHGPANAMLLRWTDIASFQPQIDPKGEEILVLNGSLADERGRYSPGTWIRNPEISWQHWSGTPGTVIFYKSGHFHSTKRNP